MGQIYTVPPDLEPEHHNIFQKIWNTFNELDRFMKFSVITMLLIIIATPSITAGYLLVNQNAASDNLLQNGSFEDYSNGQFANWNFQTQKGGVGTIAQDKIEKHTGDASAKITVTTTSSLEYAVQLQQTNLILAPQSYTLTFFAKADSNRSISALIQQTNTPFHVYYQKELLVSPQWQQYSLTFVMSTPDTNAAVRFNVAQAVGNVWLNNVILTKTLPSTSPTPTPSPHLVYFGAYSSGFPSLSSLSAFESMIQHNLSIVMWYQAWGSTTEENFNQSWMDGVRQHGSIPLITWEPWVPGQGVNQPSYSLSSIINGTYDTYITAWAQASKAWGHPYFLRFAHEMNGNWYPWSERVNGNLTGQYVKAFRHVRDIFTKNGVTTVTWIWCPNVITSGSTSLSELYPGDTYVDWVGIDGYNWGTTNGESWQTFSQVFNPTYQQLVHLTKKPIIINETASAEQGGDKAAWISDTYAKQVPYFFPQIYAINWFSKLHTQGDADWRVNSSSSSLAAFIQVIQLPFYTSNTYSNLSGGTIGTP